MLSQGIGYDRIARELAAVELDTWQEYTLLKFDTNVDIEQIYLLKMTCPSTGFIHALRVPPDINSAREAIKWVNWGVDYEDFQYRLEWHYSFINKTAELILLKSELTHKYQRNGAFGRFCGL